MSTNILSIPMFMGGASHQIPLFMLHQKYLKNVDSLNNYFLLPERVHDSYTKKEVNVLPIDYEMNVSDPTAVNKNTAANFLDMEQSAFKTVQPDIIIEDTSFSSPLLAEKNNIPRISIHRTGFFRSIPNTKRNTKHTHSVDPHNQLTLLKSKEKSHKTIEEKNDQEIIHDYLHAKAKIIPGIPLIEKLPDDIPNRDSYFYSGPLNLEDNLSDNEFIDSVHTFIEQNKDRKKVFLSTGLIAQEDISAIIESLLEKGYAVISTVNYKPSFIYKSQFFSNSFFPLNFICNKVDLVIHHCGSGMYHYPLLNEKPVITIGTTSYDREDVALRLEELGVSKHTPSSIDNPDFLNIFNSHLKDFETSKLCDFEALKKIKNQIVETMNNFNPNEVINYTLNNN